MLKQKNDTSVTCSRTDCNKTYSLNKHFKSACASAPKSIDQQTSYVSANSRPDTSASYNQPSDRFEEREVSAPAATEYQGDGFPYTWAYETPQDFYKSEESSEASYNSNYRFVDVMPNDKAGQ